MNTSQKTFFGFFALFALVGAFFAPFYESHAALDSFRVTTFVPEYSISRGSGRATLKGVVFLPTESRNGNAWFEWGESSLLGKRTSSRTVRSGEREITHSLRDLDTLKFYYYRAAAQDSFGNLLYGDIVRFRIADGSVQNLGGSGFGSISGSFTSPLYPAPIVHTKGAQIVGANAAIVSASVEVGASVSTSGYFKWGPTPSVEFQTPAKNLGASPYIDFSEVLTGLTPGATYYYRAEAINPGGRTTGGTGTFIAGQTGTNVIPPQTVLPGQAVQPVSEPSLSPDAVKQAEEEKERERSRPSLFSFFRRGSGEKEEGEKTPATTTPSSEVKKESQEATISGIGFFPGSIFGWVILAIVLVVLVALFVHVQTLYAQLRAFQERGNGNGALK